MRIPSIALLALLALATAVQASDIYWLDVVSYPAIPGWSVRHLQTIHTLESHGPEGDMLGRGQHATELTTADVQALTTGLVAWSAGAEPPNHTVWRKQQKAGLASYWLEVTSRQGADRHLVVTSTVIGTTPGRTCPQCYGAIAFAKQQMPVSEAEALDLIDSLTVWLGGVDPADAVVWSKLVEPGQ